ncbi:E1-E2 ATPase-domain-containing protein [Russula emetica]|nr:E1-E2 ATPase-domain-containing protein [Russula emetica]
MCRRSAQPFRSAHALLTITITGPIVIYEQFKFFFNLYFLLVALSQFVPAFRTGALSFFLFITYITLLTFVLLVTMGKEAYDEYKRNLRDRETNSARYLVLASGASSPSDEEELSHSLLEGNFPPTRSIPSSSIHVGDLVLLEKNQRVPADLILLRTSDLSGTCFIRTNQLDGETDWKLRVAVPATQKLPFDHELLNLNAEIYDAPSKDIHAFIGTSTINTPPTVSSNKVPMVQLPTIEPLSAENVLWANTVLAAGSAIGFVVYTGPETRAVMNTSHLQTKVGLLDHEISHSPRCILCAVSFVLSVALVALNGFRGFWYIYVFQFLILFSSIIPIRWAIKVKRANN